jgi:hypothetical protein
MGSAALHAGSDIAHKYQGVASNRVINAVQKASARTGADFTFLMEKASAESSFNPTAKAHNSSARGLYQFISDTWLRMVKSHGDKFGLGEYADQIEIKNGKPCVDDCNVKQAILDLRNNPEISALMAGQFSADNAAYLKSHTRSHVGAAELSLAHFMGANGAAKFLNSRDTNGDAIAAEVFPREARANRGVFYNSKGRARTFDEIYHFFGHKFTGGTATASVRPPSEASAPAKALAVLARSGDLIKHTLNKVLGTPALPSFDDDNQKDDIIWADDPRFHRHRGSTSSGFTHARKTREEQAAAGGQKLSASSILAIAEMAHQPVTASAFDRFGYNS